MAGKGEMLLCKEGKTKEKMTESLMRMREGRWPIGKVERTLVCREADTRMAASGRAAHVRGKRTLPLHRYKVKGPRAERREARVAAARAACAVHELWTDGDKDRKVREGWPREWMQEVEKATDAIDKIVRGRKARGDEYRYKTLDMPKGTTDNQKRAVMSCRTFLDYEPDFSPNIKALPIRKLFAKVKAHVNAEKAAKEAKGSFKTTPKPWRSDPNGRFHQGQSNAPMVDEGEQYHDDLAECMRLHELKGVGDVLAPLAETEATEVPLTPGEKWEAEMAGHEEEVLEEISGAEAMAALHAEIEGFNVVEPACTWPPLAAGLLAHRAHWSPGAPTCHSLLRRAQYPLTYRL
jgi:hypothetical protein